MTTSIKNILIGIFVLIAIGIVVFMLLFLHPSVGDNAKTLHVRFTDIDKVNVGTRVTFAGRPVGEVVSIQEIPDARTDRINQNGDVFVYELILKVDSGVDVYNTDEILLRTSGLLGERNIEINPLPLKPGEKLQKIEDEVIYATPTGSVENTLKQFDVLSQKFGIVLDDLHQTMTELKERKIIEMVANSAQNIEEITSALNQPDTWQEIIDNVLKLSVRANHSWTTVDSSLQNIYSLTDRAHHTLTTLDQTLDNFYQLSTDVRHSWTTTDQALTNFYHLSERANHSWTTVDQALLEFRTTGEKAHAFMQTANDIIEYTRQGQGTIGQLFVGNDLHLRLKSILYKGSTVMDDVNHYGILFHLDKRWQRLQARRLRLLEKLSTPHEFTKYFNNEMDQISASISRVSMLLNETDCYPQSLMCNPNFTTRFSDLLRRVENMEESLKMYNEQVVDQE